MTTKYFRINNFETMCPQRSWVLFNFIFIIFHRRELLIFLGHNSNMNGPCPAPVVPMHQCKRLHFLPPIISTARGQALQRNLLCSPRRIAWEVDICCTLRSGLHKIPTMIKTFPHRLENNHAYKWTSDNFPGILT